MGPRSLDWGICRRLSTELQTTSYKLEAMATGHRPRPQGKIVVIISSTLALALGSS